MRRMIRGIKLTGNDVLDRAVLSGRFLRGSDHGGIEFTGNWSELNHCRSRILALFTLNQYMNVFSPRDWANGRGT